VNVVVRVYSRREAIVGGDLEDKTEGTEDVMLVAEQAGSYRVEVTRQTRTPKRGATR